MPAIIYDTVTLEHFAAADRLELLQLIHSDFEEPHWVEQVMLEVQAGAGLLRSRAHCQPVLEFSWLCDPVTGPLTETLQTQALLLDGNQGDEHLGEAESIAYALTCDAVFATDDASAYSFAAHHARLGATRVVDSCAILWDSLSNGLITIEGLKQFHSDVFDAGRTMRCRCQHWPGGDSLDDRLRNFMRKGF